MMCLKSVPNIRNGLPGVQTIEVFESHTFAKNMYFVIKPNADAEKQLESSVIKVI